MNISKIREAKRGQRLEIMIAELFNGKEVSDETVLRVEMGLRKLQHLLFNFDGEKSGTIVMAEVEDTRSEDSYNVVVSTEDGVVKQLRPRNNAYRFLSSYLGISGRNPYDIHEMQHEFPEIQSKLVLSDESYYECYDSIAKSILNFMKYSFCADCVDENVVNLETATKSHTVVPERTTARASLS